MDTTQSSTTDDKKLSTMVGLEVSQLLDWDSETIYNHFRHTLGVVHGPRLRERFGPDYEPIFSQIVVEPMELVNQFKPGLLHCGEGPVKYLRFMVTGLPEPF